MKGAYDDLLTEGWDSACEHMPDDYADEIQALLMSYQHGKQPQCDADLDGSDRLKAIEARWEARTKYARQRHGQPSFDAPLIDWYHEYQYRRQHPFWYEREYRVDADGNLIHLEVRQ